MSESYFGPAVLVAEGTPYPLEVRLSVSFEPLEGRFRWAGRCGPSPIRSLVVSGLREATLAIAGAPPRPVRLGEPDPWGGVRLTGVGVPPWFPPPPEG